MAPVRAGRRYYIILAVFCIFAFFGIQKGFHAMRESSDALATRRADRAASQAALSLQETDSDALHLGQTALTGHAIAPKLGNETAKAELGRAAWKLLHTMMARFPDKPTEDESTALRSYIHLFQRLYPCGECAEHFGELLKKFPPQVSSRSAAAAWACHVHNKVNERLKKELFDCANIGDFYDCGCAEDDAKKGESAKEEDVSTREIKKSRDKPEMSDEQKEKLSFNGRDLNLDLLLDH
ncbi:FAD-linked sulfhydryl oxidase ERV2 [Pseudocercospora fuligena]|uniref:Sulfhydryl oxidase n=1 Tax=Pseudocercospora fuligena TaxID=685502 RepID=A0A8H6RC26_9PEZI|nr:FAD-linked sulfhydryl oxidase ERV2 [Pseudocercospora fuligena]